MVDVLELCENLKIEIESLKAENEALRIENAQLKEKLGLSSKNSSIPSSKKLYKIKKGKPKSEKSIGGQVGHKGSFRAKMDANEVVKVELLPTCKYGEEIGICKNPTFIKKLVFQKSSLI